MSAFGSKFGRASVYAAVAAFALSPSILMAVTAAGGGKGDSLLIDSFERFTPAGVDSALAEHFDLSAFRDESEFNFTPAGKAEDDRSVTIVVRAAGKSARFVQSGKSARAALAASKPDKKPVELGMTSYNLGAAKGLQSFALAPSAAEPTKNDEPRLVTSGTAGGFRLDDHERQKVAAGLGESRTSGGMPRATSGLVDDDADLEGSLKVVKGVAVTAGVRVDTEKNRTPRLTDDQRDNQAVYVGTLITF